MVISIDPGVNCGVCFFNNGEIAALITLSPRELVLRLESELSHRVNKPSLVVIEDSRMMPVFQKDALKGSKENAMKIARNIGTVDGICSIIQDICNKHKCLMISVSPKEKGSKVKAKNFKAFTGYQGKTNPHTRDACVVGWRYRNQ
jgi:hypothetical protein